MMEFPIDVGGTAGDLPVTRGSYLRGLAAGHDDRDHYSEASTKSSARRTADGGIMITFGRGNNAGIKLAADVDELERERLMALMDIRHMTWRHRWFSILEGRPHEFDETLSLAFNIVSFSVVIVSCAVFATASSPTIISPFASLHEQSKTVLFWLEAISILYFIAEALLRVICVPLHLLITPLFVIDIATIVGFFTDFFSDSSVSFLRVLRLLRVFRVMKISRYSRTLQLVFKVFAQSASGLSVLLMPIFLVVITAATVLYFVEIADAEFNVQTRRWTVDERPAMFQSVFDGIWFTMATITTIGYGDIVPQTLGGKLIAAALSLFGVLTLSFPNLVLGANLESAFALHKKANARIYLAKRFRKIWIMVAFMRRARVLAETTRLKAQAQEQALKAAQAAASRKKRRAKKSDGTVSQDQQDEDMDEFGYDTIPMPLRLFPEMDEEPNDAAIGGVTSERGRPLFYEITVNQCASLTQGRNDGVGSPSSSLKEHGPITDDNVRQWSYKGIKVRPLLQTLFEAWSGVATLQEVFEAFTNKPDDVTVNDMAVAAMFLGAASLLNIFVLRKASIQFVCSLTYRAVLELSLGRENATMPCRRSSEFARFIWKQTTGRVTSFAHWSLAANYASWAAKEKYAGMGTTDSSPDLKLHIGVTPGEIKELRRILAKRTSDLSTVIPDIDRFQQQAEERMLAASDLSGDAVLGASFASGTLNSSTKISGATTTALVDTSKASVSDAEEKMKIDLEHRNVLKLMLLHQVALSDSLGISLKDDSS